MNVSQRAVRPLSADDAAAGVVARFREVATAIPQETAVVDGARSITFGQLAAEAAGVRREVHRRLQRAVDEQGRRVPVAVLQGHTARAVATILGVIASGHPVVVLDSRTPAPRLRTLVDRTGARVVLHSDEMSSVARELGGACGAVSVRDLGSASAESLWAELEDPSLPAALAFTSGSTGVPKVVINDQRMLVADAWGNSIATRCYGADDVVAHTLPMAFHAGLMATVAGVVVGCTMRLYDTRENGITGLAPFIGRTRCTVMHASPSILRAFVAGEPAVADLAGLRTLSVAGEPAYGRDFESIRAFVPAGCVLRNRYGSSETGLIAEYVVDQAGTDEAGALPVGRAVGTTRVELAADMTDADDVPLAQGTGVVVIERDFLASGYWGDEAATQAAFSRTEDGRMRYASRDLGIIDEAGDLRLLGRRDHSVKVRGYLVEPGDVDAVLYTLPEVREAVTVGRPNPATGRHRLVAYVCSSGERPSASAVRTELRRHLPGHLVPEAVVFLDALPRTERGKLDRAALPEPPAAAAGEEPKTEWERLVANLWAEVLDLDEIGRDSDFFELGGDSLAAEEITSRAVTDLGVAESDITSSMLAEAPVLAEYARRLRRRPDLRHQTVSELRTGGEEPPLFFIAGGGGLGVGFVPVVRHLPADRPVYALHSFALERRGIPDWTVQSAARRHVREIRRLQPQGPYHIAGHSFGGIVALEVVKQLQAAGQEVATLIELDSFPPDPALQPKPPVGRSLRRRLRDAVGLVATGIVPTPGLGQFWRFHRQSQFLSARYRTAPYEGRALVVIADSPEKLERSQWGPHLIGDWDAVETAGDHITMLRDPYAAEVAAHIQAELERVRQAAPGAGTVTTRVTTAVTSPVNSPVSTAG